MLRVEGENVYASRHKRATRRKASGFESVQNVIFESIRETERLRRAEEQPNIFLETFQDIQVVAAATIKTLHMWNANQPQRHHDKGESEISGDSHSKSPYEASHTFLPLTSENPSESTMLNDLAGMLGLCDLPGQERSSDRSNGAISQVNDMVSKAVNGDFQDAANSIWKFAGAGGGRDSDDYTVGTQDTVQDETNQIRRLGSWGTVNTYGTSATNDTGFNSCETGQTPREINFLVEDDDGNMIDPVLLQKTQKTRERRTPRRQKLVKFDYPPIKSLRQCPRPDPKDLPNLFFTEDELYQIEDDRYSTMSTDDIEIVAVSSDAEECDRSKFRYKRGKSPKPKARSKADFSESSSVGNVLDCTREQSEESGWKKPRERSSTPYRRKCDIEDEEVDVVPQGQKLPKSPSSNGRLVKGVQIFLRERSTGV